MPPTEDESVQHLKNLFLERKRSLDAKHREQLRQMQDESRELEAWAKTLGELQGILPKLLGGERIEVKADEPTASKIPIAELIDRYFAETGATECTAAQMKNYIAGLGYATSTATYNSCHEALRRRVEKGELVKDGPKFRIKDSDAASSLTQPSDTDKI